MQFSNDLKKILSVDRIHCQLEREASLLFSDIRANPRLESNRKDKRIDQLAFVKSKAHQKLVSSKTEQLLEELGSTKENPCGNEKLTPLDRDFLRVMRGKYERAAKFPLDFVSKSVKERCHSWKVWKRANDFSSFLPKLENMIDIARKKAKYLGFGNGSGTLYDGLIDFYEPGMSVEKIDPLFKTLRIKLSAMLERIGEHDALNSSFLGKKDVTVFPIDEQKAFCQKILDHLGFGCGDERKQIKSNCVKNKLNASLFSTLHDYGDAMSKMGFPEEIHDTCLASKASSAIDESQVRLWERIIGQNYYFWKGLFPKLQSFFPDQLGEVRTDDFYRAINEVKPGHILNRSDEIRYGLHIILLYELEKELISGDISPEDLPDKWHGKIIEYGLADAKIDPRGKNGILQYRYWAKGSFGYFPNYLLGDLYSAHFFRQLKSDISYHSNLIAMGNFEPLHNWLRDNIYVWGCRLKPAELLKKVTGKTLQAEPFFEYLEEKYHTLWTRK